MSPLPCRARSFGLIWASDVTLDQFDSDDSAGLVDISIRRVERLAERGKSTPVGQGEIFADGFRLSWSDALVFDGHGSRRVDYVAQAGWHRVMPPGLYSTIASLLLAGRGLLPLHATAIEIDGVAFLLAGTAGAGKSTLAGELLHAGAKLIGDDLSAVEPPAAPGEPFTVRRGRPAMRLHPSTAALVEAARCDTVPDDPRGKMLVRPLRRSGESALPLAGIVLLESGGAVSGVEAARLLPRLLFRPRWCAVLPGHRDRQAQLLDLAGAVPLQRLPPLTGFDQRSRTERVARTLAMLAA